MDRRFNLDSKKSKIVIKLSWKDDILAPLHMSTDHHACRHQDECMASVWHPDKYENFQKNYQKYLIKNILSNLKYYHQKVF